MGFSTFFSNQAKRPSGFFGRFVMSAIFDIGNAFLNDMAIEALSIKSRDHILDMGCGNGTFVKKVAAHITDGCIEGVDFSRTMISQARRRNKKYIDRGVVKITEGDFNTIGYPDNYFDKVYTVNTIYFWMNPEETAAKIAAIIKPGGVFVAAFEDIRQLEQRNLSPDVFRLYTADEVATLLVGSGFINSKVISKTKGDRVFHCVVAVK